MDSIRQKKAKEEPFNEKIEIFSRFAETKEKLTEKTIFEGHPIGHWAIQIRFRVNRNIINITKEQRKKLNALGILEKQYESTVDEKIQFPIEWNEKYLNLLASQKDENMNLKLNNYAKLIVKKNGEISFRYI